MATLFSYVVDHDLGYSPNPFGRHCTLAHCKFSTSGRANIVESARVGDWVSGTGGRSSLSAGHGKLIYAMRVSEILTLKDYFADRRFRGRADNYARDARTTDRFTLISNYYYYFGTRAVNITNVPGQHLDHSFEKRGPGYRKDFSDAFIADFAEWLARNFHRGVHGLPHGGRPVDAPRASCTRISPVKAGSQSARGHCTKSSSC